jgi:hypothetical protein
MDINFKLLRGRETIAELAVVCGTLRGAGDMMPII